MLTQELKCIYIGRVPYQGGHSTSPLGPTIISHSGSPSAFTTISSSLNCFYACSVFYEKEKWLDNQIKSQCPPTLCEREPPHGPCLFHPGKVANSLKLDRLQDHRVIFCQPFKKGKKKEGKRDERDSELGKHDSKLPERVCFFCVGQQECAEVVSAIHFSH